MVCHGIGCTDQVGSLFFLLCDPRCVTFWQVPVISFRTRVRKIQYHTQPAFRQQRRLDAYGHHVLIRMAYCFDMNRFALELEVADQLASPQIQLLPDLGDVFRFQPYVAFVAGYETQSSKAGLVGIVIEPLGQRRLVVWGEIMAFPASCDE